MIKYTVFRGIGKLDDKIKCTRKFDAGKIAGIFAHGSPQ